MWSTMNDIPMPISPVQTFGDDSAVGPSGGARAAGGVARRRLPIRIQGTTLLEIMLAVMILGVLGTIAMATYQNYRGRLQMQQAITDIGAIAAAISIFAVDNQGFPGALSELGSGFSGMRDPWGNPYQYVSHQDVKGKGKFRKDKNIVPINSDFDLYSMGKDGSSVPPLTANASRDDIVRANNGRFIGLAADYDP